MKTPLGHGWVAVGHLNSAAIFRFELQCSSAGGTKRNEHRQTTRDHPRALERELARQHRRNLEDRKGYSGSSRGLLWGGACGKVKESLVDARVQTWAFIEIVQCPATSKSEPALERSAMSGVRSFIR